jgi:hypothetical protein
MSRGIGVGNSFDQDSVAVSGPSIVSASAAARLRNVRAAMTFWLIVGLLVAADMLVSAWTALRHL